MTFSKIIHHGKRALSLLLAPQSLSEKIQRACARLKPSATDRAAAIALQNGLAYVDQAEVVGAIASFGPPDGSTDILRRALSDSYAGSSPCDSYGEPRRKLHHFDINTWSIEKARTSSADTQFAMAHIDTHNYERAIKIFDFLFAQAKLTNGAAIFVENWIFKADATVPGVREAWTEIVEKHRVIATDLGYYRWCARKFLIESYEQKPTVQAEPEPTIEERLKNLEVTEADAAARRQIKCGMEFLREAATQGHFAYFGNGNGGAPAWIAAAASNALPNRKLFLFTETASRDEVMALCQNFLSNDHISVTFGGIAKNLAANAGFENSQLRAGDNIRFSFILIDLTEPTEIKLILEQLFSKNLVDESAVIYLQNWIAPLQNQTLETAWRDTVQEFSLSLSDWGSFGLCGHKFIIHRYNPSAQQPPQVLLERFERSESEKEVRRQLNYALEYAYGADVKGELIEFGTCEGRTAAWLADAAVKCEKLYGHHKASDLDERFKKKALYLFDSFEGLPEAESPIDQSAPHVLTGVWHPASNRALNSTELRTLVEEFISSERIKIFEGWYKETMKDLPQQVRFSVIHVDCDLYQSTMDALEYLFAHGHVSEGAAVLFDDWNTNRAAPHHGERKAWSDIVTAYCVQFTDWGSYGWGGQKFLVHSYCPSTLSSRLEEVSNFAK